MPTELKHGQAYQHIERGQNLERAGRLDEAMMEFKRAVEADPNIAAAHNALGYHYQRKGLLTKAADEFRVAALLSADTESYFSLGRVLSELERHVEAAEAFQRCLTMEPDDPSARYELAYVQCAQGQFDEALLKFQELAQEYPEDWELLFAVADCQMGLKDYAGAESALTAALEKAPQGANTAAVVEALWVARRHLEFTPEQQLGFKDRVYAEYGVACVGSGRDDGLDIPIYEEHTFTYSDLAVTISRLLALLGAWDLRPNAVVNVDEDSMPLTIALSQLLRVPVLGVEELRSDDFALLVLAEGMYPEVFEVTLEHVPGRNLSFALGLHWRLDEAPLTDFVGVHCRGSSTLPWNRIRKPSAEAAAASILRALAVLPEDDCLPQLVGYYTEAHRLLRFLDLPTGLVAPPGDH